MTKARVRIRRIEFANFKAFSAYVISMTEVNILVGANNSGKSTIIGALRTLEAGLRTARSRAPGRVFFDETSTIGWRLPADSVPISLENVHTDYNDDVSRVDFHLSNGNLLSLVFPSDGGCILVPRAEIGIVTSAAIFKQEFPLSLVMIPVLGPVEHNEKRRDRATVVGGLSTHRASRHFRNYWHYNPEGFAAFAALVARTWPGMEVQAPEYNASNSELTMYCLEERMTRELYWVGFGFQIWCQLLTHISRASESSLVIVDEPEVYLHPDVQRQLLGILRDAGTDVLLATHSSEIIAEADPTELVMVDKRRRTSERLKTVVEIQRAMDAIGSSQNITLTALAKSRRVLFVEGFDDFRLFRRFARKVGLQELSAGIGLTPLESGGFGSWSKTTVLAEGVAEVVGAPLMIGAIYDRDYYCDEFIEQVKSKLGERLRLAWVLDRKEIENYLLVPAALDRAVLQTLNARRERGDATKTPAISSAELLLEITAPMEEDVLSQLLARKEDHVRSLGEDMSGVHKDTMINFRARWANLETRLALVPGKEVLRQLRQRVQDDFSVTLTDARIAEAMTRTDLPEDMRAMLEALDSFRQSTL